MMWVRDEKRGICSSLFKFVEVSVRLHMSFIAMVLFMIVWVAWRFSTFVHVLGSILRPGVVIIVWFFWMHLIHGELDY